MKQCCDIYTWLRRFVESCSCTLRATCAADRTGRKSSLPSCGSNARPAYSAKHVDFFQICVIFKTKTKTKEKANEHFFSLDYSQRRDELLRSRLGHIKHSLDCHEDVILEQRLDLFDLFEEVLD